MSDDERELPPGKDFGDEEYADEGPERDDTAPCPKCGRQIYSGADQCPSCGEYILAHHAHKRPWPWWIWLGVLLAFGVLTLWAITG